MRVLFTTYDISFAAIAKPLSLFLRYVEMTGPGIEPYLSIEVRRLPHFDNLPYPGDITADIPPFIARPLCSGAAGIWLPGALM